MTTSAFLRALAQVTGVDGGGGGGADDDDDEDDDEEDSDGKTTGGCDPIGCNVGISIDFNILI